MLAVHGLVAHIFPQKALMNQKQFMQCYLQKPYEMPICEFMNRLVKINEYLPLFPPFSNNGKLSIEEIMVIAEFATPSQWQKAMVFYGFNPTKRTPLKFVEFCKRLEYAKVGNHNQPKAKGQNNLKNVNDGKSQASKTHNNNSQGKREDSYCEYHGVHGHSTGECKVVLAQAKKMRANWESRGQPGSRTFNNKT
jgi:hypothetical protein